MAKYIVKGTDILHNGEKYPEGSEIELADKEAKGLEKYLEKIEEAAPPKGGKKQ